MNTITLIRAATGWVARYEGPAASEIRALFGTATIPTAFMASTPAETVQREIKRLNAGYLVLVDASAL